MRWTIVGKMEYQTWDDTPGDKGVLHCVGDAVLKSEAEARIAELEEELKEKDKQLCHLHPGPRVLEAQNKIVELRDNITNLVAQIQSLEAENAKLRHDLEHLLGLPVVDKEAGE